MKTYGLSEGDVCGREQLGKPCEGTIGLYPVDDCSCHISAPCGQCTAPRHFCPVCDWEEKNDQIINDYVCQVDPATQVIKHYYPRPLDSTKIDWRTESHTHSSQKCIGVYPEGATREEVEKLVKGTFGGRFDCFGGGTFEYVAYTD